jgi:hypothetical protein
MNDDDSEPTWGDSVADAGSTPIGPAANPIPNQRSMPVVGRSTPPVAPSNPHAEYQRQAAQRFGTSMPPASPPPVVSYPVVPPPPTHPVVPPPPTYPAVPVVGYPGAPPTIPPPPVGAAQERYSYPPAPARDSFIQRLMQRGVRGELFRQSWFHDFRQRNPDPFVYISFAIGVVISLLLLLIPSSFVITVLSMALWGAIGYLYFALGTKLAHQFTLFGICLVGGLVMLARVLSAMVALSLRTGSYYGGFYESAVELMFVLLINLAGAAACVYVGIQVYRGIQQMSAP